MPLLARSLGRLNPAGLLAVEYYGESEAELRDLFLYYRDETVYAARSGPWKAHFTTRTGNEEPVVPENSHLIGEVERVCDRVVILDRGRVAASGTLAELLGQREVRLQLTNLSAVAEERLAVTGIVERSGESFTVALSADDDGTAVPDLVRDLVALGAHVHAVEPARISLEERLLGILRDGADARAEAGQ